jgi:hypothetical protein
MSKETKQFRYGQPISPNKMPKSRKRLPQYDECLREFLKSGHSNWEVSVDSLPSKNPNVALSSLKWRTKHKPEFKEIKAVMCKNKIYLEKVEGIG